MTAIDEAIGARIRLFRTALGLSQKDLAGKIGVRFQQVQKYEIGANRIAASRLWAIADTLGISVIRLFEDVETNRGIDVQSIELLDLFHRLPQNAQAQALFQMRSLESRHRMAREREFQAARQ